MAILRELADLTGLSSQVSEVPADDAYTDLAPRPGGGYLTYLAAAVADSVSGIGILADRRDQHAPVAAVTTA